MLRPRKSCSPVRNIIMYRFNYTFLLILLHVRSPVKRNLRSENFQRWRTRRTHANVRRRRQFLSIREKSRFKKSDKRNANELNPYREHISFRCRSTKIGGWRKFAGVSANIARTRLFICALVISEARLPSMHRVYTQRLHFQPAGGGQLTNRADHLPASVCSRFWILRRELVRAIGIHEIRTSEPGIW